MRQLIAELGLSLAACGEKKAEPEKTPTLTNTQPSDPSPAGRAGNLPVADADPKVEAKKEPSTAESLREKAEMRKKIKARIDKLAPPVDKKFQPSR